MLKLYYNPMSCSSAVHTLLEFSWIDYEAIEVQIWSEEYKKINPRGAVPAIQDENWKIMTQIPAILKYINSRYNLGLAWDWSLEENYEIDNKLAFMNSDLQTPFGPIFVTKKFTTKEDEETLNSIKEANLKIAKTQLGYLDKMLEWKEFLVWNKLSIVDFYAVMISNWAKLIYGEDLKEIPNIKRFNKNMLKNEKISKIMSL